MAKQKRYVCVLNVEKIKDKGLSDFLEYRSEEDGIGYAQSIRKALGMLMEKEIENGNYNPEQTYEVKQKSKVVISEEKVIDNTKDAEDDKDQNILFGNGFKAVTSD